MAYLTTTDNDEVRLEGIRCAKCDENITDWDNLNITPKINKLRYICFTCGFMGSMECEVRTDEIELKTIKKVLIITQKDSQTDTKHDHAEKPNQT